MSSLTSQTINFIQLSAKAVDAQKAFEKVAAECFDNEGSQEKLDAFFKVMPVKNSIDPPREGISEGSRHLAVILTVARIEAARKAISNLSDDDKKLMRTPDGSDLLRAVHNMACLSKSEEVYMRSDKAVEQAEKIYGEEGITRSVISELLKNPTPIIG